MAPKPAITGFLLPLVLLLLTITTSDAFYLPGSYLHAYPQNSELSAKVNSLTSIDTELPFSYYSLPFCQPQGGVKKSAENLGEILMGDQIESSPYLFHMNSNEKHIFLCSKKLTDNDVKHIKQRIDDLYQVNLILDNLPAVRFNPEGETPSVSPRWTGFLVGMHPRNDEGYYIFNHLRFRVHIHKYDDSGVGSVIGTGDDFDGVPAGVVKKTNNVTGYTVVGFEVAPCSYPHDQASTGKLKMYDSVSPGVTCEMEKGRYQAVSEGTTISFSYEVEFVESSTRWPSRWDAYLEMEGAKVHWFSIFNSLMVIGFLAGIVFVILLRTVRRDLTKYEELDKEAQAQLNEELSGWKLVVGDVFRTPPHSQLLCIMIGSGVQILGMGVVTIIFAAFGFMSPASRGMLLTGMVMLYLFLGISAGYAACRLWKTFKLGDPTGWRSIAWRVACFFPGISFVVLTTLNFLLWGSHSTGAIPLWLFFLLFALWFCISVPLTLFGGFLGARAEHLVYPVRTNQIPREVPAQKYPSWLLVLGAGTLPFGTLFIELFFIMSSLWLGRFYYVFGFLLIVFVLLVVVCAEVSVVLTYMHLCVEDWRWMWKSFFAPGSVGIYVFLYAIQYLVFELHSLSGPVSAVLYLGYTLLMVLALSLATGTIGFLTSLYFTHYLFSTVKLD